MTTDAAEAGYGAENVDAITREVSIHSVDGQEVVDLRARRAYEAPPGEVWSSLSDPERLRRWFLPVTGELSEGATFQAESYVTGTIRRCEPPRRLVVTWGDEASVVHLELSPGATGAPTLELRPTVPRRVAGSGAGVLVVGPGWDLALTSLAAFLRGAAPADPVAAENTPEGQAFAKRSTLAWVAAVEASGTATAEELADARENALRQWAPDL